MYFLTFRIRWFILGMSLFLLFLAPASFAEAATIYANSSTGNDTTGDGSSGSPYKTFHKAYTVASSTDTIDLTGTFDWNSADETGDSTTTGYTIAKSLTIRGQGADQTFVQASSSAYTASRGVFVISGSGISVTIQDLTVRYGYNTVDSGAAGIHVSSASTVTLDAVAITENASNGRFGVSGLRISNSGTTTVQNSVIHNNDAIAARTQTGASWNGYTGGIQIDGGSSKAVITNTTLFANTSSYNGGVYQSSGTSVVTLTNSTIVANRGGVTSHNYALWSGTLNIKNTIIADRYNTSAPDFLYQSGTVNDGGSNIIETQSASTFTNGVKGNLVGDQASLNISASLALNSAVNGIKTLALSSGSVAIDAGTSTSHNNISVPSTDARELNRGATVDIGAFEYGAENPDNNAPTVELTAPSTGDTVTGSSVIVTASSSDDVGVSGVKFYYGNTLIGSEDTAAPFSVTWDTTATSSGSKILVAVARDAAGNVATSTAITVTVNNTPTAETPDVSSGNNSASFSWSTGQAGSTKLYFGLTSSLATSTAESNTGGSATTTHSVSLSNLPKCTTYKYVLVNRSIGNLDVSTSTERTFYTACTGNATVSAYEQEEVFAASGGTLTHDTLTLTVPSGFAADASSTAVFQASTINATSVTSAVGTPNNKTRFGNIYHLTSLSSDTETLDSFEKPITIKLSYAGLSDVDASSLFIGRYDGSSWHVLSSTVNTSDQTVTATTSAFSDIGLFGDEADDESVSATTIRTGTTLEGRIMFAIRSGNLALAIELLKTLISQIYASAIPEPIPAIAGDTSNSGYVFVRDLWLKDEGKDVKALQQYLIDNRYQIRSGATGYFGEITREALQKFQKDKGILPASGYFGTKTRNYINSQ